MHKISGDRAQMLSDTVQSSGVDADMLCVVPGEGAGQRRSPHSVAASVRHLPEPRGLSLSGIWEPSNR